MKISEPFGKKQYFLKGLEALCFTNWLFSVRWSALKTYIKVALYGPNRFYLVYMCVFIHVYIYMQKQLGKKKRVRELKNGIRYMRGFEEKTGKGQILCVNYKLKKGKIVWHRNLIVCTLMHLLFN